jgi:hypothetical protein
VGKLGYIVNMTRPGHIANYPSLCNALARLKWLPLSMSFSIYAEPTIAA